ncbi:asparagine synthetase [glutamine-hydrolyzing] 1 [Lachnospiraceae bacterium]|nr:asparagine synthetase [glutamine-hydrolyzing] 1 [Lachnospiraceae bacterium]GFI70548.1 asparagine synthetase [glutamine-hydrolyzing] 1 [Lachnospiraceae bacterium]
MAGICGFYHKDRVNAGCLKEMGMTLQHRGPDGYGEECVQTKAGDLGVACTKLNIQDCTKEMVQPLWSEDGRVLLAYDGSIYNTDALKNALQGFDWRGKGIAEVLIAAYLKWGMEFLNHIDGMFSMMIFDRKDDTLYLCRDHMGKKPLYYYYDTSQNLVFGSEIQAILTFPGIRREPNKKILASFLYHWYFQEPDTAFKDIYKVKKGHYLKIQNGILSEHAYWTIGNAYAKGQKKLITDYDEAKHGLQMLLKEAVRKRMDGVEAVGGFLSGGYDSSMVCALMQENSSKKIRTYCMGFEDEAFDERGYAECVANHLGTDHRNLCINDREMLRILDLVVENNALPIADYATIPTLVMASEAKKDNDVILTGVGGDELFMGGLSIYAALDEAQKNALAGRIIYYSRKIPVIRDMKAFNNLPFHLRLVAMDKNAKAATQIGAVDMFDTIKKMLVAPVENNSFYFEIEDRYPEKNYGARRSLVDLDSYTVELELLKEDSATMYAALERRCPIYDKNVMEYVFRMPYQFKMHGDGGKRILRDVLYEYVPKELVDRPKSGFNIPAERLLNTYLKDELLELSDPAYLRRQGLFYPESTSEIVRDYLKPESERKRKGHFGIMWTFYIYQKWYRNWMIGMEK